MPNSRAPARCLRLPAYGVTSLSRTQFDVPVSRSAAWTSTGRSRNLRLTPVAHPARRREYPLDIREGWPFALRNPAPRKSPGWAILAHPFAGAKTR